MDRWMDGETAMEIEIWIETEIEKTTPCSYGGAMRERAFNDRRCDFGRMLLQAGS